MSNGQTFGAEVEWGDIDRTRELPKEFYWDIKERTVMNSNGIAVDGAGKHWKKGGEILFAPAESVQALTYNFSQLLALFPEAALTHRNGIHIHIRVPGLKEDLAALKSLQQYIHTHLKDALPILEPISNPLRFDYKTEEDYELAIWHSKRMKRSHQSFVAQTFLDRQAAATSPKEFFQKEKPQRPNGTYAEHLMPRCCVNLRQMLQTDTIEFRHFFSTLSVLEFEAAAFWCERFLHHWRIGSTKEMVILDAKLTAPRIPKETPRFDPILERRFRLTAWDGTVKPDVALANAKLIEAVTFSNSINSK